MDASRIAAAVFPPSSSCSSFRLAQRTAVKPTAERASALSRSASSCVHNRTVCSELSCTGEALASEIRNQGQVILDTRGQVGRNGNDDLPIFRDIDLYLRLAEQSTQIL